MPFPDSELAIDDLLIEHGREAFVEFADRFLDLCALDEVPHLHEEGQPLPCRDQMPGGSFAPRR